MILQIVVGAIVARKVWKSIGAERDFRKLLAYGLEVGVPYLGEPIEEYRAALVKIRNEKTNENNLSSS